MENQDYQEVKTGLWASLTTGVKVIAVCLLLGVIGTGLYFFAPGLLVSESVQLSEMIIDEQKLDNVTNSDMIALPSEKRSSTVLNKPLVRMAGYGWNGQTALAAANGGPFTTKGSLMEMNGVNLQVIRQDWLSELRGMQMKFIEQYDGGEEYPSSDKSAFAIIIMGDGAPFYISTMQSALNEKFSDGNGGSKYHVQVVGAIGMSNGEDKLIGPAEWKQNPQSMIGALISTVPGDGDWVTTLNYCGVNNLPVNPDFTTYDPNAVNIYPSENDDYIKSAEELIKSQKSGFTVQLKEVVNGKLTGNTIDKAIDGCATWTPGDKMVFDALDGFTDIASTADFPNQMATTIIAVKEWSVQHPDIVSNILKSALTGSNQIKQYDQWARFGSVAIQNTFQLETPEYWYDMFKGQVGEKNGLSYNMGGTRVLTYADAMQYYGMADGKNRYKSVYNQVSTYLTELNPFGFNESVDGIVPYGDAVNLYFLKNINDIEAGVTEKTDYTTTKTTVMAQGEWNINFATGSDNIKRTSDRDLSTIYNLLVQAEQTKLTVIGHTDNTGSNSVNEPLSRDRANAVVEALVRLGLSRDRIQEVDGKGSNDPLVANNSKANQAKNRRVSITLLQ